MHKPVCINYSKLTYKRTSPIQDDRKAVLHFSVVVWISHIYDDYIILKQRKVVLRGMNFFCLKRLEIIVYL